MTDKIYNDDDLVPTPEAAAITHKHPVTLAVWRKQGRGPAYTQLTDARGILYRVGDLRAWAAKDRVVPKQMQVYARTCEQARVEVEVGGNAGVEQALNEHKRSAAKKSRGRA